jgi:hypothetical protein
MGWNDFNIGGGGVDISRHARKRWNERVPSSAPDLQPSTWLNAEYAYAPEADCDETKLFRLDGARDMLLCGQKKGQKTVVVTVLYADYDRLA